MNLYDSLAKYNTSKSAQENPLDCAESETIRAEHNHLPEIPLTTISEEQPAVQFDPRDRSAYKSANKKLKKQKKKSKKQLKRERKRRSKHNMRLCISNPSPSHSWTMSRLPPPRPDQLAHTDYP